MVLLCVGNINPFNRLVRTVDAWAADNPDQAVFAQIGASTYDPNNFSHIDFFGGNTSLYDAYDNASLLVSDLSIENLLPAIERGLPILAMPRLSIFGEELGIGQATLAQNLKSDAIIQIAEDEHHLFELLSLPRKAIAHPIKKAITPSDSNKFEQEFVNALRGTG